VRLAPLVLFSAAIPFQGGEHHVNEQWLDRWAALFQKHGYVPIDSIRKRVWQDDSVEWWYAQNTLLFAQAGLIENNASLKAEFEKTIPNQLCLVHPRQYRWLQDRYWEAAAGVQPAAPHSRARAATRLFLARLRNALRKRLDSLLRKETPAHENRSTANSPRMN